MADPEIEVDGDTVTVGLMYPRVEGSPSKVTVELYDVRAADDLTVSYDFDRDGWAVTRVDTIAGTTHEFALVPAFTDAEGNRE